MRRYRGTANAYTVFDEAGQWLGEYDNTGAVVQQAVWLDGIPVGLIAAGKLHYLEADALGTPRVVIDPQRDKAVWSSDLAGEAFGVTTPNQDVDADGTAFAFNLRFPGQRYDAASGLNYNYFRDYDAATGRYTRSDLWGLKGGISTYSYADQSPLNWIDRFGLAPRGGSRNFSPGAGGNAAQRRNATREFFRNNAGTKAPDLRLPSPEADDWSPPGNSVDLTPYQGTCRQLESFGVDLCGPGPKTRFRCLAYECETGMCTADNPSGWSRGPFMHGPSYSFAKDPNCRCIRMELNDLW